MLEYILPSMHLNFYKTDSLFDMLALLIAKGRKQGLKFNIFFSEQADCKDFSSFLWMKEITKDANFINSLAADESFNLQPIIIATQKEYRDEMKKDVAIVIGQDMEIGNLNDWQKVLFVNTSTALLDKYKEYNRELWEYSNSKWNKL